MATAGLRQPPEIFRERWIIPKRARETDRAPRMPSFIFVWYLMIRMSVTKAVVQIISAMRI